MSHEMISRNPDLKRLRDEGYDLEIRSNHLLIKDVPFVNKDKKIERGILVSEMSLAGDKTITPTTHVVMFKGSYPCSCDGVQMEGLRHQSVDQKLTDDLVINHSFSSKPAEGYKDYYQKMVTYIRMISHPAQAIDEAVTARTYPICETAVGESVFHYFDTATSRAGIGAISKKLEIGKIGIVGVGGTGSYILDLVSKTPVREINLFDGDFFSNHNAFRSPGAATRDQLRLNPKKVTYFKERYSAMHSNIIAHDFDINEANVESLRNLDFVFLCLHGNETKLKIVEKLEAWGISFIDVGMGVHLVDESLLGVLTVTLSTSTMREHVKTRVSFSGDGVGDEYSQNIQIADLNALNATLAVIKWKKSLGFYHDRENEHFCAYTIDGNRLANGNAQKN